MIEFILLGLAIGFLVGLSGVGGGSLMTPSLIFLGVRPEVAVGTDFLFSLLTKIFATALHGKKGNVRIDIAWRLIAGSVPAVLLGAFILIRLPREELGQLLVTLIGVVLVVVSALSLGFEIPRFLRPRWIYVYILGFIVGLSVQLTSVGAGIIVTFALMNIAKVNPGEVVGTSIVFGLFVSLMAFATYAHLGYFNLKLALTLTLGAIPGIFLGVNLASKMDRGKLKKAINVLLLAMGVLLLLGS